MHWLLTLFLLAGCGRVGFETVTGDGNSLDDGDRGEAGPGPTGPFSGAAIIPGLSHPADDDDPAVSPDGLELYFSTLRPGGMGASDIWASVRSSRLDPWPAPAPVTVVNSAGTDKGASISDDGLELWFVNNIDGGDQIYVSTRSVPGAAWSAPVLVPALSTPYGSGTPHRAGDRVVFRRRLMDGTYDLVQSSHSGGVWSPPQLIAELATMFDESSPELAAGGARIYFDSNRGGDQDVYVADFDPVTNQFGSAVPVAGVSTGSDEGDASLSADQRIIVFQRNGTGDNEIWMATR